MTARDSGDIERSLERLAPKAIPAGLRQRGMDSALETGRDVAMTPRRRASAAGWLILTTMVMIGDAVSSKRQFGRISALLGGPGVSNPAGEEIGLLWAELGSDLGDLDKLSREGIIFSRLGSRRGSPWAYFEAQDRLKGMIDHEDPENYY